MPKFYTVQYLRALAALAVVIFHALESSAYPFLVGAAGVDIFFVISGFIMGILMHSRESDPVVFFRRRIARIVPLYWVCTLGALACFTLKPGFLYQFDPSFGNLIQSLLFVPHAGATKHGSPMLMQGWTLEYEMFFYVLCTITLALPVRSKIPVLLCALLALTLSGAAFHPAQKALAAYTSPMLLEFAAGLAIAATYLSRALPASAAWGWSLAGLGLAALAAQMPLIGLDLHYRLLGYGAPAVLLVLGCVVSEQARPLPVFKFGILLGDASYALYLTHGFVVAAFLWKFSAAPLAIRLGAIAGLSILLAVLTHRFLEKPLLGLFSHSRRLSQIVAEEAI